MFYEIWDLDNNKILNSGSIDIFGITFLSKFIYYAGDYVAALVSKTGDKEILLYNFLKNERKSLAKGIPNI